MATTPRGSDQIGPHCGGDLDAARTPSRCPATLIATRRRSVIADLLNGDVAESRKAEKAERYDSSRAARCGESATAEARDCVAIDRAELLECFELYEALRRILPETDARSFARDAARAPRKTCEHNRKESGLAYVSIESTTFSEDLLALLAVQSPELDRKVEEYRRDLLGLQATLVEEEQ
jgi:hypothetical protein